MKACILANGNIKNKNKLARIISRSDLIICADGGARHLKKIRVLPHVIIGDFDSLTPEDKAYFEKNNIRTIKHPADKDATDTELAAIWAFKHKACDITFTGVSGTRLDHTLANIFLLKKMADLKIKCRIIDDYNEIYLVTDKITLKRDKNSFVSIIPLTKQAEGVSTSGLKYPLNNAKIDFGTSRGISNKFSDEKATIFVKKGILIVTKSRDCLED